VLRAGDAAGVDLHGKRIGLITNHTGVAIDGTSVLSVLRDELSLAVVSLFSPEHGFTGSHAAGATIDAGVESSSGLLIHSLYGDARAPSSAQLEGVDVLVFDIQDVGVRFYTYISTMKLAMDAAAAAGIDFVVLDRPNPNGGLRVEGPVLDRAYESFVGIAPIALLHGMTVGELASLFAEELEARHPSFELSVVRMAGWKRAMFWDDTGLAWPTPSPNLRSPHSSIAYPAFGLIEGVNVSEGRGVESTFEVAGAPWMDGGGVVEKLHALELAGVSFAPASFTPRSMDAAPSPKYLDEGCNGFSIRVIAPAQFRAVATGLNVIEAIRELHPERFSWVEQDGSFWIDRLLGTDRVRIGLDSGMGVSEVLAREAAGLELFLERRGRHLLY
jgi:uncharacterized protein YbbC (DUF1343 family)